MPRGLTANGPEEAERAARGFVEAFNGHDIERFASLLDPEVELHSMRGLVTGRAAARDWATRSPGGVQQTIDIVEATADDGMVLLEVDRVWHWAEDGTHASTDQMAWLFEVGEDGLITSWRPFEERSQARLAFDGRESS